MPDAARPRPPVVLASITGGFAGAVAMWTLWLASHAVTLAMHGTTTAYAVLGACCLAALLAVAAVVGRANGPSGAARIGLGAGLVAGLLAMLLLGSKVVEQPETTEQMADAANRLRPDAALIVTGFLVLCALVGAAGGVVGGATAPRDRRPPAPGRWLAWFGVVATLSMIPLLGVGGAVTSTESGMAVPDGVTSYGAFSALFPISLMSEPRIFLEHSHRLFASLVGIAAIAWYALAWARSPRGERARSLISFAFVVPALAAWLMSNRQSEALAWQLAVLGVCAVGALGWAHAMIARGRLAGAAGGLLALIIIQGAFGATRVSEALTGLAAVHGVFAQVVFATGAMVAALGFERAMSVGPLDDATAKHARGIRRIALIALVLTTVQIALGGVARHFDSNHGVLTHAGFSFIVVGAVVVAAAACGRAGAGDPVGRAIRSLGRAIYVVLFLQFILGWMALWATMTGESARPIPLADQLADAPPLPIGEALVTTPHQTGGALLLAAVALVVFWARRAARAGVDRGNARAGAPVIR